MGSLETPRTWIPYMNTKNCSQGFCSIYCPQWCYMVSPPPPPFNQFSYGNNSTNFSPLVIAIIGIFASAFLLVSYYTIISKYCGNSNREITHDHDHDHQNEVQLIEDNHNPFIYEAWQTVTTGLEEAVIKAITVCKYKKGEGLIDGSDCSVCLSEFQENESLRLLPKCSHAFHVPCIDTWLKSHSNCPLCRANIVFPIPSLPPLMEIASPHESAASGDHEASVRENIESVTREELEASVHHGQRGPKSPLRVFSDLGDHSIIEIGEIEGSSGSCGQLQMRRSISMDHSCQISCQILRDDQFMVPIDPLIVGTSKNVAAGGGSSSSKRSKRVFNCGLSSPMSMKRSFSSGRIFLLKNAVKGRPGATVDPQEAQI